MNTGLRWGLAVLALGAIAPGQDGAGPARSHVVAGRVTRAGTATAATVVARWLAHPELPGALVDDLADSHRETRISADAAGRFRIELPSSGPFAMWAENDTQRSPLQFPVLPGDFLELALVSCPILRGAVCDEHGRPVAGARVTAGPYSGKPRNFAARHRFPFVERSVHSEADGTFAFAQWPSPAPQVNSERTLRARHGDRVSANRYYLQIGQTEASVRLTLTEAAAPRPAPSDPPAPGTRVVYFDGTIGSYRTDPQGRIRLDREPAQGGAFVEIDDRFVPHQARDGSGASPLAVRMRTRTVRGLVLDPDRQPVGRAIVMIQPRGAGSPGSWIAYTDRGGRFVVTGLPERELTVGVIADATGLVFKELPAGADVATTVVFEGGIEIAGQVSLPTGAAAGGSELQLTITHPQLGQVYVSFLTNADGRFRIRNVPKLIFSSWAFHVRDGVGYMNSTSGTIEAGMRLHHVLRAYDGRL